MADLPFTEIHISGPTLSSLLHQSTSSPCDIHGLLFGHVIYSTPTTLSDDPITPPSPSTPTPSPTHLSLTLTSFISLPSHLPLPLNPPPPPPHPSASLLGHFSARRRSPLRPSLKDSSQTHSLSSTFSYKPQNTPNEISLPTSIFLLLTTPLQDQLIHTHEYKVFQYSVTSNCFESRSLKIVNIGPGFRPNYEVFLPCSNFPLMEVDEGCVGNLKDQKVLDGVVEGFEIGRLGKMMGSDALSYKGELEGLYGGMVKRLDSLARMVEKSDKEVMEQENHNMKLRCKIAGLGNLDAQ